MWRVIRARMQQGHRTTRYPDGPPPALSDRHRGPPIIDPDKCVVGEQPRSGVASRSHADDCRECIEACPTEAISASEGGGAPRIDLGRCLFCTDCVERCPVGALTHSHEFRLAAKRREDLVIDASAPLSRLAAAKLALDDKLKRLLGRSLKLRQVSAGGCNGCESDTNVLGTIGWDISRFGIQFVASPRHADGILVTGAVSENMRLALEKTWAAIPEPKIAIAVGACAISGGPYLHHPECHDGLTDRIPIDLYVPGCPPHPLTILDGLLRLIDRLAPG